MNLDLVVLDWSGTISNDFPMVHAGINSVLEYFGKEPVTAQQLREEAALYAFPFFHRRGIKDDEKVKEMLVDYYKKAEPKPQPIPGAVEVVRKIHEISRIAIFSSHVQREINQDIVRYGLGDCLTGVVGDAKKDTGADLSALLIDLGVGPHNVVYIGDMIVDVELANIVRTQSIAVVNPDYGYQLREQIEAHSIQPTLGIIDSITELPDKIRNNF